MERSWENKLKKVLEKIHNGLKITAKISCIVDNFNFQIKVEEKALLKLKHYRGRRTKQKQTP